jgi:4a-hydroxytetrahydrobiopterin dehydratase
MYSPSGNHQEAVMAELLTEQQITARLASLPQWARDGDQITRHAKSRAYSRPGGVSQIFSEVAVLADAANHHPDVTINWRSITFALSTHDAGGLTSLDFDLAAAIDEVLGKHDAQ